MRHAVCACIEERNQVAGSNGAKCAVAGEEVACFADWAYDIDGAWFASAWFDGNDLVIRLIECGADEVVHCGIGYYEGFFAVALYVDYACE